MSIGIYGTQDFSADFSKPTPKAYISYDTIPNEESHDYKVDLVNKYDVWAIYSSYPPKASRIYVRIDGGMNDESWWTPAYHIKRWGYIVDIRYKFCASDNFTGTLYHRER
jgi:hypothetical protein